MWFKYDVSVSLATLTATAEVSGGARRHRLISPVELNAMSEPVRTMGDLKNRGCSRGGGGFGKSSS